MFDTLASTLITNPERQYNEEVVRLGQEYDKALTKAFEAFGKPGFDHPNRALYDLERKSIGESYARAFERLERQYEKASGEAWRLRSEAFVALSSAKPLWSYRES